MLKEICYKYNTYVSTPAFLDVAAKILRVMAKIKKDFVKNYSLCCFLSSETLSTDQ
jgi:hypothetical protein